ncbi:uncharacterized protein LAESUDRAFT_665165, partial [Laetiporus sulphureus 93-53]
QGLNASLSVDSVNILHLELLSALEKKTRTNYGAGLKQFTQFCNNLQIPEPSHMPASDALLTAFLAHWQGRTACRTVDNWLTSLHFWHTLNGTPWRGDALVRIICEAVSKAVPMSSVWPRWPPVSLEHMHALHSGLNLTNSFDTAVYACTCVTFWSVCQLGELVILSAGLTNPHYHVLQTAKLQFHTIVGSIEYATLPIPWMKTTQQNGAVIIISHLDDPTSPIPALRHHLSANAAIPDIAPFFTFKMASGGWAPLTRTWFLDCCNIIWTEFGLQSVTSHSFCISGATELLLCGMPPDVVIIQGHWKSHAFLDYWHRIEQIIPLFITNSFDCSHLELVRTSMNRFQCKYSS